MEATKPAQKHSSGRTSSPVMYEGIVSSRMGLRRASCRQRGQGRGDEQPALSLPPAAVAGGGRRSQHGSVNAAAHCSSACLRRRGGGGRPALLPRQLLGAAQQQRRLLAQLLRGGRGQAGPVSLLPAVPERCTQAQSGNISGSSGSSSGTRLRTTHVCIQAAGARGRQRRFLQPRRRRAAIDPACKGGAGQTAFQQALNCRRQQGASRQAAPLSGPPGLLGALGLSPQDLTLAACRRAEPRGQRAERASAQRTAGAAGQAMGAATLAAECNSQ